MKCHPNITMEYTDFKMTVTGQHSRPVLRQACEGILISKEIHNRQHKDSNIELMNSKTQFYQPGNVKIKFGGLYD